MIKTKKQMYIVIGAFALILLLGATSYAFFSYTRTRSGNTVATGRISFTTSQSTINLTNAFPVDVTGGIPNDANNVGVATINVKGDTTYGEGIEYKVEAVGVTNTAGSGANTKSVPISIDVSVTNNTVNDPATNLGSSDSSYYSNRGGSSSIYKIEAGNTINTNDLLLVGYIAEGAEGVDGNIVIKAYFDMSKIAITDTDEESEWAQGKTVFTTSEWNSLRTNGVSFQVRVTAQEGVWLDASTLPTCPGPDCVYMAPTEREYTFGDSVQSSEYDSDYTNILYDENRNFIGLILNGGNIERAYACGLRENENTHQDVLFCIEGVTSTDPRASEVFTSNTNILQGADLWDGNCNSDDNITTCFGNVFAETHVYGGVEVSTGENASCLVSSSSAIYCY